MTKIYPTYLRQVNPLPYFEKPRKNAGRQRVF